MRWIAYTASIAVGAAIAFGIAATKPAGSGAPAPYRIFRVYDGTISQLGVWHDLDTGCQYLSYRKETGLTPRLNIDGSPLCIGPLPQQPAP